MHTKYDVTTYLRSMCDESECVAADSYRDIGSIEATREYIVALVDDDGDMTMMMI